MRLVLLTLFIELAGQTFASPIKIDTTGAKRQRHVISAKIGTAGPGVFYNYPLSLPHRLDVQAGVRYLAYRKPIRIEASPGAYIHIVPDFMIGMAETTLRWHPFPRKHVYVTAGVGYNWHPNLSFVITANDKLNFGGLELTPDDVGTIHLRFRWRPVIGYVGWGFVHPLPHKRFGIGFEMGVHYLGKPTIRLNYEGFLETTNLDEQVPIVERNLSGYRYLPALNGTISYRLNR